VSSFKAVAPSSFRRGLPIGAAASQSGRLLPAIPPVATPEDIINTLCCDSLIDRRQRPGEMSKPHAPCSAPPHSSQSAQHSNATWRPIWTG